jgi:hypothetical protein
MIPKHLADQDHYEVLEVPYNATSEQIRQAYEAQRSVYAGDSLAASVLSGEETDVIRERIAEAYATLGNEEKRRLYDESLARRAPHLAELLQPTRSTDEQRPSLTLAFPRPTTPADLRQTVPALDWNREVGGRDLRRVREAMGVDLGALAQETKVGVTMWGYIEAERLDRLPARVFLRSFLMQYAHFLGLPELEVANRYLERIERLKARSSR